MLFYASLLSKISTIISIVCLVYVFGLVVFVIIRKIILKRRAKKDIKKTAETIDVKDIED